MRYPKAMPVTLPEQDKRLVQIVDAALLDAEWRSGAWLICKPGCTPCRIGVFAIDQLDALRLQNGLSQLESTDPGSAARVGSERANRRFPGDRRTGILGDDDGAAAQLQEFADFEPCPALDPQRVPATYMRPDP